MTDPEKHAHSELEQHEVKEVLRFLTRYGKLIGAGILAAVVTVLISRGLAHHKAARMTEAEQMLMAAQTPQQLEDLVERYSSTPSAPVALLDLAKTTFNSGDAAQARAYYEQFLNQYKHHDMRPVAELGLAYCTEADGDFDAAAEQFAAFAKENEGSFLQPMAVLSIARCMEQAGRVNEARIVLEDYLAGNPDSSWAGSVESALKFLGK